MALATLFGRAYDGGYWRGNRFFCNCAVNNSNVTHVHNVYSRTMVNHITVNNISYNGGRGGLAVRPTSSERAMSNETHRAPTEDQVHHHEAARTDRALLASVNHGRPAIAVTSRPGDFAGRGVVRASRSGAPVQLNELPKPGAFSAPRHGRPDVDQSYRARQDELKTRQQHERDALRQRQGEEHDRLVDQRANQARAMPTERQHQQQTRQLQQRHAVEARQMRQSQHGRGGGAPQGQRDGLPPGGGGPHEGHPPHLASTRPWTRVGESTGGPAANYFAEPPAATAAMRRQ